MVAITSFVLHSNRLGQQRSKMQFRVPLNPTTPMNIRKKPILLTLVFVLLSTVFLTGCNTVRGIGKDTERAGEKIQEKATR